MKEWYKKLATPVIILLVLVLSLPVIAACAKTEVPPASSPTVKPTQAASPTPAPVAKKITLAAAGSAAANLVWTQMFKEFIADVNKRAEGQLQIDYKGGPELMKAQDLLITCGDGKIDMFYAPSAYYQGIVPEYAVMGIGVVPWSFDNFQKLRAAIKDDLYKISTKKTNTTFLAFLHPTQMTVFTSKIPVKKATDLKGAKIRTAGGWDAAALGVCPSNSFMMR